MCPPVPRAAPLCVQNKPASEAEFWPRTFRMFRTRTSDLDAAPVDQPDLQCCVVGSSYCNFSTLDPERSVPCLPAIVKPSTLNAPYPGVESGANLKAISHTCHLFEVVFVWELTQEIIPWVAFRAVAHDSGFCSAR